MDISGLKATQAPAPEQLSQAKKIESKPAADQDFKSTAPAPQAEQQAAPKPSDPNGVGKFYAVA